MESWMNDDWGMINDEWCMMNDEWWTCEVFFYDDDGRMECSKCMHWLKASIDR